MKTKKFLCYGLLWLAFIFCFILPVSAEEQMFGEHITWVLEDGVLTLSGEGETFDFAPKEHNQSLPWDIVRKTHTLVIEEGITGIGKDAFHNFYSLRHVSFPKSLETIGERAFAETNIEAVVFSEGSRLQMVGKDAFYHCTMLDTVDFSACGALETLGTAAFSKCDTMSFVYLPQSLKTISEYAFYECEELPAIKVPYGVESIGNMAFSECSALLVVEIPATVKEFGDDVFLGSRPHVFGEKDSAAQTITKESNLHFEEGAPRHDVILRQGKTENGVVWEMDALGTLHLSGDGAIDNYPSSLSAPWYFVSKAIRTVEIGEGITFVGRENFANFPILEKVILPSTMKDIGEYAFMGCKSLKEIRLPEGLATIASHAFYSCQSIKELHLPSSLYAIGGYAFYDMNALEKFSVAENNTVFATDDFGVLYSHDFSSLMKFPVAARIESYVVPAEVKRIESLAFADTLYLKSVSFADGASVENIFSNAFCYSSVESITLPGSLTEIAGNAFYGADIKKLIIPEGVTKIGDNAFSSCQSLTELSLPKSLQIIGNSAFYMCNGLTSVELPEGLTTVGATAFGSCEALQSISFPASATWIDATVVDYTPKLESFVIAKENPYYRTDAQGGWYYNTELLRFLPNSETTHYIIQDGTTQMASGAFSGAVYLEEVVLPESLTVIPYFAFGGCKALASVTIPQSITVIENAAFSDCHKLEKVIFSEPCKVERIGVHAFKYCTSLKEFYLPDSVSNLGNGAFYYCTGLLSFYAGENTKLENIEYNTFGNCPFVTIFAPTGSALEQFAVENRMHKRVSVQLDGEEIAFDTPPMIKNGRTMVPIRGVFEAMGAFVTWNDEERQVVISLDNKIIVLTAESTVMTAGDQEITLDVPVVIVNDRTFIPLRAVSESLGCEVSWDNEERRASIVTE